MHKVILLRTIFFTQVVFSLYVLYQVKIVQDDFHIFTNPDGPDTTDYFLIDMEADTEDQTYEGNT